ncbi:MAG: hypothetical protein F4Y61_09295, partial [Rhodothermaceae bacterium]|nr:hypothetical protein [Rhodothermaceae bacterium]
MFTHEKQKGDKAAMSDLIVTGGGDRESSIAESGDEQFDQLIDIVTGNLAASSRRVYRHTY